MKIQELCEMLTTILPHQLIENAPNRRQYGIAYKDVLIMLVFDIIHPGWAVVSFYEQLDDNTPSYKQTSKLSYSGPLFATVIRIIKQEFEKLDVIAYTASGNSRKSLYGTLAKKYSTDKKVYILPTAPVEVTIVSSVELSSESVQKISEVAQQILSSK